MAVKIIDRVNEIWEEGGTVVSFEFFPAKTEAGVDNLLARVESMSRRLNPTFVTLTWRSAFKDERLWLRIGSAIQNDFNVPVLLHLTCHLPVSDLKRVLRNAREAGIRNILALRGDPPIGEDAWRPVPGGLCHAVELVQLIREEHGDWFCVCVAGYPETHTECWNDDSLPPSSLAQALDLKHLKEKVDAGADFVITQFFYDVDVVLGFVERCEEAGITIPILPGYMPVQTYRGFRKFSQWCRTRVPEDVDRDLAAISDDDAAVREYGVELAVRTCRTLLEHCPRGKPALHFYTMNLEASVSRILDTLGLRPRSAAARSLPWDAPRGGDDSEEVRPIFWANRVHSYLGRTSDWDAFPNGRWGDSRSPAYGELTDYYLSFKRPKLDRRRMWGVPSKEEDVWAVFVAFLRGDVPALPWCESGPAAETTAISSDLEFLNYHGFLTINSQPRVNGAPSDDEHVGWGGPGGLVFQKAYVECFVRPAMWDRLRAALDARPSFTYHAVDADGNEESNAVGDRATAVTWGVFPGREILQPTVVDPASFRAWKDEAFALWTKHWGEAYLRRKKKKKPSSSTNAEGSESKGGGGTGAAEGGGGGEAAGGGGGGGGGSGGVEFESEEDRKAFEVIEAIRSSYLLVNIVDNSYAEEDSDIFVPFSEAVWSAMRPSELREELHDAHRKERMRTAAAKLDKERADLLEAEVAALRSKLEASERENAVLRSRLHVSGAAMPPPLGYTKFSTVSDVPIFKPAKK